MDSTVDVLSEQPWGRTYTEIHDGYVMERWAICRNIPISFPAQFKLVRDSDKCYWNRGDIILFNSGYYNWSFDNKFPWKKWFLQKEDYLRALRNDPTSYRDKKVPRYARLEFGIVLSRYKWNKEKEFHGKTFQDYGSIIMMLTGRRAGHIRRYYQKTPYALVSRYPYNHIIPFHKQRGITEIPEAERIANVMQQSENKDYFILNMIESFNEGE